MRIVSLLPSVTEIVCSLGFKKNLVGRSHECDYPPGVQALPVCSEPKFNPHQGSPREIDQHVKTIVRESLSVYRIGTEKLKELGPDVIVTQDHCEVCAVSLRDVQEAICTFLDAESRIISLKSNNLKGVWQGMRQVADGFGNKRQGEKIIKCNFPFLENSYFIVESRGRTNYYIAIIKTIGIVYI